MTHEDAGKYAAKHSGSKLDERIASRIREVVTDNTISCAGAHKIAEDLNVTPGEVGITVDLLEFKISKCQLGFFGYGKNRKLVKKAEDVNPDIAKSIEAVLVDGKLTCKIVWDLADKSGMARIDFAGICEKMGIKVSSCQLGAF